MRNSELATYSYPRLGLVEDAARNEMLRYDNVNEFNDWETELDGFEGWAAGVHRFNGKEYPWQFADNKAFLKAVYDRCMNFPAELFELIKEEHYQSTLVTFPTGTIFDPVADQRTKDD